MSGMSAQKVTLQEVFSGQYSIKNQPKNTVFRLVMSKLSAWLIYLKSAILKLQMTSAYGSFTSLIQYLIIDAR